MSRQVLRMLILTLIVSTIAFAPAVARARVQDAPATPDPFSGVTTVALAVTTSGVAEGHALVLLEITMAPGASIPAHSHPGDVALTVQSGTFGTMFTAGEGTITRAAAAGAEPVTETTEPNVEELLMPGDSLVYGSDNAHTMRNAGADDLVLLVAALLAADQPGFAFVE